MVITDDARLEARLRGIYSFGRQVPLGYNYRMPELQAAVGRARLPRLDADNEVRGGHALFLDRELAGLPGLRVQRGWAGTRVVYYFLDRRDRIYLLLVYAKGVKDDLTRAEENELRKLARALEEEQ